MPNVPNVAGSQPPGGSFSQGIGTKSNHTFGNFPSVKRADSSNPVLRSKSKILDAGREFPGSVLNSGGRVKIQTKPGQDATPPRLKDDHQRIQKPEYFDPWLEIPDPIEDDNGNDALPIRYGLGTRVFKSRDTNYEKPRYIHNDLSRNVFICFTTSNLRKVISILKRNPGTDIFDSDLLKGQGIWYDLDKFEDFAEFYMDLFPAVYDKSAVLGNRTNHRLNGKIWTTKSGIKMPTAEVSRRNAVLGVHLFPTGIESHVDYPYRWHQNDPVPRPNLSTTDSAPLFLQESPSPYGNEWTGSTIHIHPLGALNEIDNDMYTWDNLDGTKSNFNYSQGSGGPSDGDRSGFGGKNEGNLQVIRWVVVDRRFIYLFGWVVMRIKRLRPDKRY